jgi:hypothetical protein
MTMITVSFFIREFLPSTAKRLQATKAIREFLPNARRTRVTGLHSSNSVLRLVDACAVECSSAVVERTVLF